MSRATPARVAKTGSPTAPASRVLRDVLPSTGQPLDRDTRRDMESRFSADFSSVRVHTDAKAADSAQAVGALAFSVGPDIAFGPGRYAPCSAGGRHLLAHELAHVVQQERRCDSVSSDLTVGSSGDAAERTAHAVAAKVSAGERVPPIPPVPGPPVLRRYALYDAAEQLAGNSLGWKHPGGKPLRVADDGEMVAEDNGWGADLSKRSWTTPALVADSNARLAAQGSKVKLVVKGDTIAGKAPEGGMDRTLNEIEPVNAAGGVLTLASDCGSACKEVMGTSGGKDVAVLKEEGNSGIGSAIGAGLAGGILGAALGYAAGGAGGAVLGGAVLGGLGAYAGYKLGHEDPRTERLTPRGYHGGNPTTAEQWSEELYKKEFGQGLTRQEAYARYAALSESEKDAFDRKYGINKYAVPEVGQGLTVSTEKDMPGFASASGFTWNFHYAATVLRSGSDYITLESAAGWGPEQWIFFMYGPESKKQSFHEFQGGTGTHGTKFTTLVVEPEHPTP